MSPTATAPAAEAASQVVARAGQRAAADPRFARALQDLVEAPAVSAGSLSRAAAGAVNEQRRAEARARFVEGALTTAEVQRLLGLRTPQAVHRLRSRGKLIGRPMGNVTWFPAWQLREGERRADLDDILDALRRFTSDAIAADRVMRLQREELGGRSVVEALDRPRLRPTAQVILSRLGA